MLDIEKLTALPSHAIRAAIRAAFPATLPSHTICIACPAALPATIRAAFPAASTHLAFPAFR